MDIGTAKPTAAERAAVPPPPRRRRRARRRSGRCARRRPRPAPRSPTSRRAGKRALLVGGTGLYVQAVVDGLSVPAATTSRCAPRLEPRDRDRRPAWRAAYDRLAPLDPLAAAAHRAGQHPADRARARGASRPPGRPFSSFGAGLDRLRAARPSTWRWSASGCRAPSSAARIERPLRRDARRRPRATRSAGSRRTASSRAPPRQAIGYKEILAHLDGEIPTLGGRRSTWPSRRTRQFARRQRIWFRRDPRIRWLGHRAKSRRPRGCCPGTLGENRCDRRGPTPMTLLHLAKLHATGNDFLVRLALDGGRVCSRPRRSPRALRPPPRDRRRRPHHDRSRRRRRRRRLHDDAAERRRRRAPR